MNQNLQIERINKPGTNGLYVFEAIDNVAKLHHFQYHPEDEATEETVIKEQTCNSHHAAYILMLNWYKAEKDNGFPGYHLTREPVRVRDFIFN